MTNGHRILRGLIYCSLLAGPASAADLDDPPSISVVVVVGAAGAAEYEERFETWAGRWSQAARRASAAVDVIRPDRDDDLDADSDRGAESDLGAESLEQRQRFAAAIGRAVERSPAQLWIVLIGHGTFDGKTARFNLAGPDVSAGELAGWLDAATCPTAVVNCTAMSSPFVNRLSGPGRVVITATRSGSQENITRFGDHLSASIVERRGDFDKDGQLSLFEAAVDAAARTAASYETQGRLASENAVIDDNGDGRATRLDWFDGFRLQDDKRDKAAIVDGKLAADFVLEPSGEVTLTAEQRERRAALEERLEELRGRRETLRRDDYFDRLEAICVELARLYEADDSGDGETAE